MNEARVEQGCLNGLLPALYACLLRSNKFKGHSLPLFCSCICSSWITLSFFADSNGVEFLINKIKEGDDQSNLIILNTLVSWMVTDPTIEEKLIIYGLITKILDSIQSSESSYVEYIGYLTKFCSQSLNLTVELVKSNSFMDIINFL